MKLSPLILVGSLAANAALVVVYLNRSAPAPDTSAVVEAAAHASTATAPVSGGTTPLSAAEVKAAAAQGKIWSTLNTSDLKALAARLRAAGFPPDVVRAVISAQIMENSRAKLRELVASAEDRPFWETNSRGNYDSKAMTAVRDFYREQNRLLKETLGADYAASESGPGSDYQQRRYGNLPREKIDQLSRIDEDYNDLRRQITEASRGIMLPEDREKLALLEKEKRADLAKILSPEELDDFLVRSSTTTSRIRTALTTFNATEDEFRAIYKVQSAFDEKYNLSGMGMNMDLMRERQDAQKQVAEQLKTALGEQRYADYARASDREFQSISRIAQQANVPDSAAVQTYNLRDAASKESNRIFADTALTTDQKRAALQTLAQNTRTQITATLGDSAGATYLKVADTWLSRIERGAAVTFNPGGGTQTRNLPAARPPGSPASNPPSTTTNTVIRFGN